LGLQVVDGPHPRADLIAFDASYGLMAIEAKGLDGCAREQNLRQADRWVADIKAACLAAPEDLEMYVDLKRYAEQLTELGVALPTPDNVRVKGAMVIGTFRKLPLDKRVEPDFPDAVTRAVNRSGVCGLTGLQLMCAVLKCRQEPAAKSAIIEQLFSTNGHLLQEYSWSDFLSAAS
jgi:hypothetical protein